MADVFLSYSQADDFYPENWVTTFHEELEKMTKVTAGKRDFRIYRDTRDRVGNELDESIMDALKETKFLLALISPLYFEDASGWCRIEREYFVKEVVKDPEHAKCRIIAALKAFEKDDEVQLPEELKTQFRYPLFKLNKQNIPKPLLPDDPEWEDSLLAIARNIKIELRKLEAKTTALANWDGRKIADIDTPQQPSKSRTVFLAASKEHYYQQLQLKAELEPAGVMVKSLMPNIKDLQGWKKELARTLGDCAMSVHLFGSTYETREGLDKSIEDYQWQWAIELAAQSELTVMSWLPKDAPPLDEQQRRFIDAIKSDDNLPEGHDYLEKTFEEFIGSVKDYLTSKA